MNFRTLFVFASLVGLLTGCTAPQLAVPMAPQAMATPGTRVGIVMTSAALPNTRFPGADCLLCMAAAELTNSTMTGYTKTLPVEDVPKIKTALAERLKRNGATVVMIDTIDIGKLPDFETKPNFARKNFGSIQSQYGIDKLIVIAVDFVGVERNYAAYIPSGDPKASVRGLAYMVNLKDNAYDWYEPIAVLKASDGKWDEPPTFPGLTNAYFQSVEAVRDQVLAPFPKTVQ